MDMDSYLSEPAKDTRKKVEEYMSKINCACASLFDKSTFASHVIPEIAKLGVMGGDYPKELGGKNFTMMDMGSIMYEFARRDTSIASFFLLHHALGNYAIYTLASDFLRNKILKETLPLKKSLAWALMEPDTD